jgi:hypothetical protein
MSRDIRSNFLFLPATLLLGLALSGCSGGGSSGSGSGSGFQVETISVQSGSIWQINRPIEIRFNQPVDFSTVNLNTIQVFRVGGGTAAGEFRVGTLPGTTTPDPKRIVFSPRCPTLSNYSDAGFAPGGVAYRINIVGGTGFTVESQSGGGLSLGQTRDFTTPNSLVPTVLFVDTASGPPAAIIRTNASNLNASYLELGGSDATADRVYFQPRALPDAALGADVPTGFLAPLNLYSSQSERVSVLLTMNQALDPASSNINSETVRLEYKNETSNTWLPLANETTLVANCTETGSVLRLDPIGILPQDRQIRVVLSSNLRDLVGDVNLVDVPVAAFRVKSIVGDTADELLEEFSSDFFEDQTSQLSDPAAPRAIWDGGVLKPNFDFDGNGGPGGDFDWEVGSAVVGSAPENVILDTTFTLITNANQTATQAVVNGVVNVRNFTIFQGSSVTAIGPNPLRILASGNVVIDGRLICKGSNNRGVATLDTTCIPEIGSDGNLGGGKGGSGSYLTTQSTPKGQDGFGAFNLPGLGGEGGHSSFRAGGDSTRRPGGGGGGALGANVFEVARPTCFDQTVIGLDAERGFPGTPGSGDALLGAGTKPQGGIVGTRPFADNDSTNDFLGLMVTTTGQVVRGELAQIWAGAGGGGGGDSCNTAAFPTTPFLCSGDEKGCGGGGGGGSVTILALGDIRLGQRGVIDAGGGVGGGGENSASGGITRIGGGSGGGSGGHIILQSASQVDLSNCQTAFGAGIFARGGQGGAGKNDKGGAKAPGLATGPSLDALPANSYPTTAPTTTECEVVAGSFGYTFSNTVGNGPTDNDNALDNVVTCAGGDGGPGIIQIHVQRLSTDPNQSDLKIPTNSTVNPVRSIISPPPVGSTPANIQTPGLWNQLLPQFGRFSTGVSAWIPLGGANVQPGSSVTAPVDFLFGGTSTTTGLINSAAGVVTQLPSIFTGTIANEPALPYITADDRSVVFDGTGLDAIYKQNPSLLRRFQLRFQVGAAVSKFEVTSASWNATSGQMRVSVASSGAPLGSFVAGAQVTLIPRFFGVSTNGTLDSLPASSAIRIRFQAAKANAAGLPDLTNPSATPGSATATATTFLDNPALIQTYANAKDFVFFRFRVDFDILNDGSSLSFQTPRPEIDFLRVPFKF